MTIHKSQGLSLKKAWVDLGPSEECSGMTYVALSRVKKIEDLIVDPMTMERMHPKSRVISSTDCREKSDLMI